MKRLSVILSFLLLLSVSAIAQVKVGFFSRSQVMAAMPEYLTAQEEIGKIRAQYDAETKRSEEEFNAKYEDFLDNLNTYAPTIRRKRQTELQQQMESNIRFREEAKRLMAQSEEAIMNQVKNRLDSVLAKTAKDNGFIIVLNTDSDACPYIDPMISEDITPLLLQAIKKQ